MGRSAGSSRNGPVAAEAVTLGSAEVTALAGHLLQVSSQGGSSCGCDASSDT